MLQLHWKLREKYDISSETAEPGREDVNQVRAFNRVITLNDNGMMYESNSQDMETLCSFIGSEGWETCVGTGREGICELKKTSG